MSWINRHQGVFEMNYLDLFSGIGGFALGFERAGWKFNNHYFSEIDKNAIRIYQQHFPTAIGIGNITGVRPEELGKIDLVTFGFPCQDLSVAGKRAGLGGSRSGLFFEAMRLIKHLRPSIFIFENVKGLLTSNRGQDFETVLREIADIGLYECEWQLLNTSWFLPQNRERVYFIGHLGERGGQKVFPIGESHVGGDEARREGGVREKYNAASLKSRDWKDGTTFVECCAMRGRNPDNPSDRTTGSPTEQRIEINQNGTTNTLTSVCKDNLIICPKIDQLNNPNHSKLKYVGQVGEADRVGDGKILSRNAREGYRVYDSDGLAPSLRSQLGGASKGSQIILIPEATRQGYAVAEEGDSINLSVPNSKTRRGRVGKGVAQTLDTQTQQFTIQAPTKSPCLHGFEHGTNGQFNKALKMIRRLTPTECERLQGFPDGWTEGIAETQRYKCLGNAVTVNVVEEIAKRLLTTGSI